MATIRNFRDIPPGGWRYVQPETGMQFTGDTYEELVAQVRIHREYKKLPTETLELDVQRQLCVGLDTHHCAPEPGEDYRPVRDLTAELTTEMVYSLSRTLFHHILKGAKFIDKAEAESRAAVCRGCPFNKPASLCSCSKAYQGIEALIPKDRRLGGISVCMACGCSLQAKANLAIEVIAAGMPDDLVVPDWCWQKPATLLRASSREDKTT